MSNSIFTRTSIRKYEDKPVEDEKITMILKAAMAAPSAGNQQPWEFCVVRNKQKINELSKAHQYAGCVQNAPVAIVVCSRLENLRFPDYTDIDCSICSQNILLEVTELGLGAVWIGIAPLKDRIAKVNAILSLPDNLNAFAIIALGYPAEVKKPQERFDANRIHYIN